LNAYTVKTIGILGGGQLARMSLFAAKRLGFNVAIIEKEKNSPAGQLTHLEFTGSFNDRKLLKKFAEVSDVITLENEFVDAGIIGYLEDLGKKVFPSSQTIALIQDKLYQKQTLQKHGIPVAEFTDVTGTDDFEKVCETLGLPFILKSRKMGYDGYGIALVKNRKNFNDALEKLRKRHLSVMAEKFIRFKLELATIVVRTKKQLCIYPVVRTVQRNHICHIVTAPAEISGSAKKLAGDIAIASVEAFRGYGIFAVEMFLTSDNRILVNEMAPRPHNSGHYTIEGCVTSQFENHIRSVLDLPLGSSEMVHPYAVMVNILGKTNGNGVMKNYKTVLANKSIHLHIYGKSRSSKGRKMGHITVTGSNLKKILSVARQTEKQIII